jgi:dTDP-4-dehydrorhamnose reductase
MLCKEMKVTFIHFSSACIFDSKEARTEDDTPNPKCFYTQTKAMADKIIQEIYPGAIIIRLRMPASETPHKRNLLNKISKYKLLHQNPNSITILEDFIPRFIKLIEDPRSEGIYHFVNSGTISMAEIGEMIGSKFEVMEKRYIDSIQGGAQRVDSVISSNRIPLLPNIHKRLPEIIKKWRKLCV